MNETLITITEAARRMGVSRVTIYAMIKRGILKSSRVGGVPFMDSVEVESQKMVALLKRVPNK